MKKILASNFVFILWALNASATTLELDNQTSHSMVMRNFEEDSPLLKGYLDQVKDAQLHFFWTTGRTLSENSTYEPILDVQVSGATYGHKFFPYVEGLLKNSPYKLKIMFTCDTMTVLSNATAIESIQQTYAERFEILPIETVHGNLLKAFPEQRHVHKMNVIFKNATQGSPVLTSDIYRVIGMIYGQNNPSDPTHTLRSYCDIDAFCYGMASKGHTELTTALFKSTPKTPFYFGRSHTNNDVIKLHITEIDAYKKFCEEILDKVQTSKIFFPQYNAQSVTRYFCDLHEMIKKCENDPEYCAHVAAEIPEPIYNIIREVTQTTGPQFLYHNKISYDLSYPSKTIGEWGTPEAALDHRASSNCTDPPSVLNWGYGSPTPEEEGVCDDFMRDCDAYRKLLGASFYARAFGAQHPFNMEIKKHLLARYPYHAKSFKALLKENFKFHNKDKKNKYSLKPMASFPEDFNEVYTSSLFVENKNNQVNFAFFSSEGKIVRGTLDLMIEDDLLNIRSLNQNKGKILDAAEAIGIKREPTRGLSYQEWQQDSFKRITRIHSNNHHETLTNLLQKLGIHIPMTLETLNF